MNCSARNGLRRVRVLVATAAVLVGATLAAPAPAAVLVADQVDADGNFVGETLPDTPLGDPARGEAVAAYRPPTLQGTRTVAVIPVEFADLPLPFSAAQMRTAVFAGGDSVNAFMRETSFGFVSLAGRDSPAGDVYPTVQIAESSTTCDHTAYSNAALAALRAQGHNVTGNGTDGYHHYVYIWPRVASCGYAGLASVPGNRVWINGTLSVSVISHELGHNFGLAHANSLRCQDGAGTPVVISDLCANVAYGDPFETMGSGGMHFSGMTKSFLGWFGAGQSVRVTASATLTLDSSSFPAAGLKSIEIPRSATESWFVETRSIFGRYDNFAPSAQPLQGVLIRRHAENTIFAAESQLIDAHPATSSVADAAFVPGETFTDPASGIAVEVRARTPTSAVVAITIGGVTPPAEPPGTPPPPPAPPPGAPPVTPPPPSAPPPAGGGGAVTPIAPAVKVTTDRALAKGWTSRISVRRLAGGRVLVSGRVITRAKTCRYRLTTSAAFTGRCERLSGGPLGWRVLRNVRGGRYVTIVATSASGNVLMRRRMLVPATVGDTRYYRL